MPESKILYAFDVNHLYNDIEKNLMAAGYLHRVALVTGDFANTLPPLMTLGEIAFAFIDHDHRLVTTKLAYDLCWPKLVLGGIMAFHDYLHGDYPEPTPFFQSLPHVRYIEREGLIAFIK